VLANTGLRHVIVTGLHTDRCASSTVRGLADESIFVVLLEDGCAAVAEDLHQKESEMLAPIDGQVMRGTERLDLRGRR
jgi:biuret amidohydrolase